MAIQKERRAAPRKPGTKAEARPSDTQEAAPKPVQAREMPASSGRREREPDREPPQRQQQPASDDLRRRIEMAAYLRAQQRGFTPGYELDDWLQAEAEVKDRLQP